MVIFLTGLVSMILMRTLRNDYAKYAREDDDLESLVMPFRIVYYLFIKYITYFFAEKVGVSECQFSLNIIYSRREMLVKNLAGNLFMVMFSGLLAI